MPENTSTALAVGQIRMDGDMRFDFRFDRLRQQPTRTGSQNIRQRIGRKRYWLAKRNNCIFLHGVSFLLGNRRLRHRQDTPPSHHNVTNFQT